MADQKDKKKLAELLLTIPWFQQLSERHLDMLVDIANVVEIPKGQDLFKEGDEEDDLYVVVNGRIAIEIFAPGRGRVPLYTAEPLDVVGWSSVTPVVRQRTASARAVMDSRLIALDANALRQLCDGDCALGCIIFRRIANVIAGRLMVTRLQLLDLYASPAQVQG
jgi:CRP-like cAMP-binding protein